LSCAHVRRGRLALALAVSALFSASVTAAGIEIPDPAGTSVQPPPTGPGIAASAPIAAAPTSPVTPTVVALRPGSRGAQVRDLQRELRRRGARISIDGRYGPTTKRAVIRLQRRLGLPVTGVADLRLLRRLGIQVSVIAGGPAQRTPGILKAFPVLGDYDYIDSWGAPRSQGSHEGTDVMAARNTPLVAVADGTITRMSRTSSGLGGIRLWLTDSAGNAFYYAHMQFITEGLNEGTAVRAGQIVGGIGDSGDAQGGPTHVHFEIHPFGRGPVNPYAALRAVDPRASGES